MSGPQINPATVSDRVQVEAPIAPLTLPIQFYNQLTQNTTTPSVKNVQRVKAANIAPITLTNFTDGQEGQEIIVKGDGFTSVDISSTLAPTGGLHLLDANAIYRFVLLDGIWHESNAIGPTGATGPPGPAGAVGPQGDPGPAGADGISSILDRETFTISTANLAPGATESSFIELVPRVDLYSIEAENCRVVFYATALAALMDAGRGAGVHAPSGKGIFAEFGFASLDTILCSPIAPLVNGDVPKTSKIYYSITNTDIVSRVVNVTILYLPIEAP